MQHESSTGSRHDCPSGKCTERVSEKSRGEETPAEFLDGTWQTGLRTFG